MTNYYRVQKVASGVREYTEPMTLEAAKAHLESLVENLLKNGYVKSDRDMIRRLPVVILGLNGNTVALSVVECTSDDATETQRELAQLPWLTRAPVQIFDLSADEDTAEIIVDRDLTPDDIYNLRDGKDDFEQESAGV